MDVTSLAAGLPAELHGWPSLALDEFQLADLELLLTGVFSPLTGFMTATDAAATMRRAGHGSGSRFPFPVTLDVPADAVPPDAAHLVLEDAEGAPLAALDIIERTQPQPGGAARIAGPVRALRSPEHGPFRRLRRAPHEVRAQLSGPGPQEPAQVLGCATRVPLHRPELDQLCQLADALGARLLVLPLITGPASLVRRPDALVRAVLAARPALPADTLVVPVPLAPRGADGAQQEVAARALVAAAHGATHLFATGPLADRAAATTAQIAGAGAVTLAVPGAPIPVVLPGEWAFDRDHGRWRPTERIDRAARQERLTDAELIGLLDSGAHIPDWFTPQPVARELRAALPPRRQRGLVIFFTGLSGAGKSTIARDVADALAERGDRSASLLDGDHVRRLLSAGLGFSAADRDLNIARIGYVAAEIARHGGVAICAPIAPYAAARAQARRMAGETGGDFLLVHVATPLAECEARDRKGLYAKARAGTITGFTGVSDPYEAPQDADLTIDTSALTRQDAADAVLGLLTAGGWLAPVSGAQGARQQGPAVMRRGLGED